MTQDDTTVPEDDHDASVNVPLTHGDWDELLREWQLSTQAVQDTTARLQWPVVNVQALDAWLSACERQTVAKTRLAALCELQLRKG